jgi:hypothetical protein
LIDAGASLVSLLGALRATGWWRREHFGKLAGMATGKNSKKAKPYWERGYDTHGYWRGKKKIGWVALEGKGKNALYRWQAGNRTGEAKNLLDAKRQVENTVEFGASQLPLFGDPGGD